MATDSSIKIVIVANSTEEVNDCIEIANKLAGVEYNYFHVDEVKSSNLRILEFLWNTDEIQLWNVLPFHFDLNTEALPAVCLMNAYGLIVLSNEAPIQFLQRNNNSFFSMDFPILWITNESLSRANPLEASLQALNVSKVTIKSPADSNIITEFNQLLNRIRHYIASL